MPSLSFESGGHVMQVDLQENPLKKIFNVHDRGEDEQEFNE